MVSYGFPMFFLSSLPIKIHPSIAVSSQPLRRPSTRKVWNPSGPEAETSNEKNPRVPVFLWQKVVRVNNMQNTAYMFLLKKHRNLNLFVFLGLAKWHLWCIGTCPPEPGRYDVGGGTCNLPIHQLVSPSCVSWNPKGCKVWGQIPSHWPCHWHTMDACLAPTRQPRGVFLESWCCSACGFNIGTSML